MGKSLKAIVLDWSDTERKGRELAVGRDTAEKVMVGCLVHYGRSYQRVADKVSASFTQKFQKLSRKALCTIARAIPHAN